MVKYSKDGKCVFDSVSHTYHVNGKKLIGVTTFIGKFKNKFDAELIAENYAIKHKLNKQDVLDTWEKEGELSCIYGSAVHDVFEKYILTGEIITTGLYDKEKQAIKFINEYFITKRLIPVEVEMVVYNEELGIASQIDCIAKNIKNEYFILDWKTNKKIETNGYKKFMLHPFNKLPDANFYHYSLQLSIYKKLCMQYDISGIYIVHLDNDSYKFIKAKDCELNNNMFTF